MIILFGTPSQVTNGHIFTFSVAKKWLLNRRANSITTHHFKFTVLNYKFSDFTIIDIRVAIYVTTS